LKRAYTDTDGSLDEIMNHIPHSTIEDEPRFVRLITNLIKSGDLNSTPTWERSVRDETARLKRKKKSAKEAEEAEVLAKELGVWDEFYGGGKPMDKATKKQRGKRKADTGDEEDVSALQALILKRKKNMDGFFDDLAAKYAEPEPSARSGGSRGKKRKADVGEGPPPKKSKAVPPPPDIDDDEFAKIQESLMTKKTPTSPKPRSTSKGETRRKTKR